MTLADDVIQLYQQAALANRNTPSRRGSLIQLGPPADQLIVSADLHGHRLNLQRVLETADLANHPGRRLVLQEVCHGGPPYPATNACMSHLMLEDIAKLKVERPEQVHFLLSNHELAELIDLAIVKGNRMLNLQFRFGLEQLYGDAADQVHNAAREFIRSCPLAVRTQNRVLVCHSAPPSIRRQGFDATVFQRDYRNEDLQRDGPAFKLVWGRDFSYENAIEFAKLADVDLLVHGHEPCHTGYTIANPIQLILDSSKSPACCLKLALDQQHDMDSMIASIEFL